MPVKKGTKTTFGLTHKVASIFLVHTVAFLSNLIFIFFLPDRELFHVIGAMALSGFVSGSTVSNNTAKIYSKISTKEDIQSLSHVSLILFACEQATAVVIIIVLLLVGFDWLPDLHAIELALLVFVSCTGALVAFTRVDDQFFILLNLVRAASTLTRLGVVFWLISHSADEWIPTAIIVSFAFPMGVALYCVLRSRSCGPAPDGALRQKSLLLMREYAWGIPVAISRAFINHGVLLTAVAFLNPDELRMFRFLLLPKDAFGKMLNALLPLFFDRMFRYSVRLLPSLGIMACAAALAAIWYTIGTAYFGFGWSAVLSFTIYLMLNLTVYSVLPISWRTIHRDKAINTTMVVFASSAVTFLVFWLAEPSNVDGILIALSTFSFCYIFGMLMVSRSELARTKL